MLEEITSGEYKFTDQAFGDWAPVRLIATGDKPLELLWANEYSVLLPQSLAIVDRAALEAHNVEMTRLQRELAELRELAEAVEKLTGWANETDWYTHIELWHDHVSTVNAYAMNGKREVAVARAEFSGQAAIIALAAKLEAHNDMGNA